MIKQSFFILYLLLFSIFALAQSELEIKKSGTYLYGEGKGRTLRKADKSALQDLISQISVTVSSDFKNIVEDSGDKLKEYSKSVINTYSSTSLTNAKRLVLSQDERSTKVLRYIRKSDIHKIFEQRKEKVLSFIKAAIQSEKEYNIGDAIKNYCWALILLQTHPKHNQIKGDIDQNKGVLKILLHNKIEELLSSIKFRISHIEELSNEQNVTLEFRYKGKLVGNLDFVFWDGRDWSPTHSVKDGIGAFTCYKDQMIDKLKLKIKYIYDRQSILDKELDNAIKQTEDYLPIFNRASHTSALRVTPELKNQTNPKETFTNEKPIETKALKNSTEILVNEEALEPIKGIVKSLAQKNSKTINKYTTDSGKEMYKKLLKYGKAKYLTPKKVTAYPLGNQTITRSFPMSFAFQHNHKKFVESVVFTKDKDNKVDAISFALSDRAYNDIMDADKKWNINQKRQLVNFIEHYKTSYALKRLKYIESIFSEDALIIIGHKLKKYKKDASDDLKFKKIAYKKYTKKQYISRLKHLFNQKEYVNIQFGKTNYKMSKIKGVYGVSIEQNYYSNNYFDKGYLFLVVDLRNYTKPKIHVRTWQEKPNLDSRINPFKLSDFF